MQSQMLELRSFEVTELNSEEIRNTNGGEPVTATAIVVTIVVVGAVLLVGAAVGYGLYKLVDWATS